MRFADSLEVAGFVALMKEWVESNRPVRYVAASELPEVLTIDEKRVWTEIDNDEFCYAVPGFLSPEVVSPRPVVGYYFVERAWNDPDSSITTSKDYYCPDCDLTGEGEGGELCETCEGDPVEWIEFGQVG